jgi:N-acetylmuramoyl-L-alanine amidase
VAWVKINIGEYVKKQILITLFAITSLSLFAADENFISPLTEWKIASLFGWRADPSSGERRFHSAIDLSAPHGASVSAALDGTVSTTGYSPLFGNYIILKHSGNYRTLYAYLDRILVESLQEVTQGEQIGLIGSSAELGEASDLLHFAVYKEENAIDPLPLILPHSIGQIGAIVIDPGHGGKDEGAIDKLENGETLREKDLALSIALDLAQKCRAAFPDIPVILTRDTDLYLSLADRVQVKAQNDNKVTLFVSLHANSSVDKSMHGFEAWYADDVVSQLFAMLIVNKLDSAIGREIPSLGTKMEDEYVGNKGNNTIPVLIELGFLSNKNDAALLSSESYQKRITNAILSSIKEFAEKSEQIAKSN